MLEAMERGLGLSKGQQKITGGLVDQGQGTVHFSLWTAPCALDTAATLSLQSVLGEWEFRAEAECAAWRQVGASGLRAEPCQGRA